MPQRGVKTGRARGDVFRQGLQVLQYIHEEPRQPGEIAALFGISRRTVERILRTAESLGLDIQVTRRGRGAWYRLGGGPWPSPLLVRPSQPEAPSPSAAGAGKARPAVKAEVRRRGRPRRV